MADGLLPDVFHHILAKAPELTFSVTIGLGDALRKGLRDGTLDLTAAPVTVGNAPEFAVDFVADGVLVVAARPDHPIARRRNLAPASLGGARWMLPAEALASTLWLRRVSAAQALPEPLVQVEVSAKTSFAACWFRRTC